METCVDCRTEKIENNNAQNYGFYRCDNCELERESRLTKAFNEYVEACKKVGLDSDDIAKGEKEEALAGRGPVARRLDEEEYSDLHRLDQKPRRDLKF